MTAKQSELVRVERANGLTLISFEVTTLDEKNFVAIADALEVVARSPRPQSVVIDMTGIHRMDVLGLAVLQSLQESVKDVGGTAVLCGPTGPIERALHETRLAREIEQRSSTTCRPPLWTLW